MNQFKNFLNRNKKILAMTCMAILFAMASIISCFFLLPSKREKVSADTVTYWTDYAATAFASGSGTSSDPYLISNASELAYLASQVNSGEVTVSRYYKLTKPIVLSDHYWVPIGQENYPFNGVLDCNNQPIIGMKVDGNYEYAGLFGLVDSLVIKNAIILNANINITSETGSAGILVGTINYSLGNLQVIDSQFSGSITSKAYPAAMDGVGGVIGTIRNCYPADSKFENVYLSASINVPNRPSYSCTGQLAGNSEVNFISNNVINVVAKQLRQEKVGQHQRIHIREHSGTQVTRHGSIFHLLTLDSLKSNLNIILDKTLLIQAHKLCLN